MPTLVCNDLRISPRVWQKMVDDHDLDPADVRATVECVGGLPFRRIPLEDGGSKALVSLPSKNNFCLPHPDPHRGGRSSDDSGDGRGPGGSPLVSHWHGPVLGGGRGQDRARRVRVARGGRSSRRIASVTSPMTHAMARIASSSSRSQSATRRS